jgi:hypothetical protein
MTAENRDCSARAANQLPSQGALFVTGAATCILFIFMSLNIDQRIFINIQIAVLPEEGILFPGWHLDVTGQADCSLPGIIADWSSDHPVYLNLLTFDLDQLRLIGGVADWRWIRRRQISNRTFRTDRFRAASR